MSFMRCVILLVVLASACANDGSKLVCHAPEHTSYSCQPIDLASADDKACVGGPAWRSVHSSDDAALTYEDPDLVFPDGCVFRLNECGCCYDSGRVVVCTAGHWVEPL